MKKSIIRCTLRCFFVLIPLSILKFTAASQLQNELPSPGITDTTVEKPSNPKAIEAKEKKRGPIPIPANLNLFSVELKNGKTIFTNFRESDGKILNIEVSIASALQVLTGKPDTRESELVKIISDAGVCYLTEKGILTVTPLHDQRQDTTAIHVLVLDDPILSKEVIPSSNTLVAVTSNGLIIMHPMIISKAVGFASLFGRNLKSPDVVRDHKDENCVLVRENGKTVAKVHGDATNKNNIYEMMPPAAKLNRTR